MSNTWAITDIMSNVRIDRVPPQDIDAERAVLGAMMIDIGNGAIHSAMKILGDHGSESFYREAHQKIYDAVINISNEGEPIDLLTVTRELERTDDLEKVGGVFYLDELIGSVPTAANIGYYARMVKDEAIRRSIIYNASEIYNKAFDPTISIENILSAVNNAASNVINSSIDKPDEPDIKSGLSSVIKELDGPLDCGIQSGFTDLDKLIFGFPRGTVSIVAGPTTIGKSKFVESIVSHNMKEKWVLYFSTEMAKRLLQKRFLASAMGVSTYRLEERNFSENMWTKIMHAANDIGDSRVLIFDNIRNTALMHSTIKWYKMNKKADLVVIDHLGHLKPKDNSERRVDIVSSISNDIHDMAVLEDVPIIAVSHMRRISGRDNKRPVLSDLRDSGTLENDADRVIFLFRQDYYDFLENGTRPSSENVTEIIVAKDRIFGNIGSIELTYSNNTYQNKIRAYKQQQF